MKKDFPNHNKILHLSSTVKQEFVMRIKIMGFIADVKNFALSLENLE